MDIGETKKWLNEIRDVDRRINAKLERYERLKAKCYSVTVQPKEVSVQSSGKNSFEDNLLNVEEFGRQMNRKIDELVGMKLERQIIIDKMRDNTLAQLLEYRYIDCMSWAEVARKMNYEENYIKSDKHSEALQCISKLLS